MTNCIHISGNEEDKCWNKTLTLFKMTFSQSMTVTVGVSKWDYKGLIFVDPGIKINEICYCEVIFYISITTIFAKCLTLGL